MKAGPHEDPGADGLLGRAPGGCGMGWASRRVRQRRSLCEGGYWAWSPLRAAGPLSSLPLKHPSPTGRGLLWGVRRHPQSHCAAFLRVPIGGGTESELKGTEWAQGPGAGLSMPASAIPPLPPTPQLPWSREEGAEGCDMGQRGTWFNPHVTDRQTESHRGLSPACSPLSLNGCADNCKVVKFSVGKL